jgi:hypothetical protein
LVTSITNTVLATTTPVTSESAGLNAAELLRQIEIPKELRMNPQEAAKYQMEMLRKKVKFILLYLSIVFLIRNHKLSRKQTFLMIILGRTKLITSDFFFFKL